MTSNLHCACLRSYVGPRVGAWFFVHSIVPPFCLPFNVFSSMLRTRLGFSHLLAFKVTHAFVTNLQILQGPTFFIIPMVGMDYIPWMWSSLISLK